MRGPLHVIQPPATYLAKLNAGGAVSAAAARITKSGDYLKALLDDLVDYNRTNLGLGIHIAPVGVNLADLFRDTLDELRAGHPSHQIDLQVNGDVTLICDPHRIHQVVNNLVSNALKYGTPGEAVRVVLIGEPSEVEFSVHNRGRIWEFQITEVQVPGRSRGRDYRSGIEDSGWMRGEYSDTVRQQGSTWLAEAVERKRLKSYSSSQLLHLLL